MSALIDVVPSLTLRNTYQAWAKGSTTPQVIAQVLLDQGYEYTPEQVNAEMRELDRMYREGYALPWS